jgi:hypothetical protein
MKRQKRPALPFEISRRALKAEPETTRTFMKIFLESPEFLKTIESEAHRNSEVAQALTSALSETQLNWKPSAAQWSMAQCLEHLTITSGQFDRYFSVALERARRKWPVTSGPHYLPSMVGGWLARQVNPEGGRNFRRPKYFARLNRRPFMARWKCF